MGVPLEEQYQIDELEEGLLEEVPASCRQLGMIEPLRRRKENSYDDDYYSTISLYDPICIFYYVFM